MAMPEWLPYVGSVTGCIGAVTGISGAIMGFVSYRRTGHLKALDLRLQLRKAEADLHDAVNGLPNLLEQANRSRANVSAAIGMYQSGQFKLWTEEYGKDTATIETMIQELPAAGATYSKMSHSDLESALVRVHVQQQKAQRLRDKYRAALAADDRTREQIQADARARVQAMRDGGR